MADKNICFQTSVKLARLKAAISAQGNLLVAFSGGVDSTFLLAVAREVLGENVIAVTRRSVVYPQAEALQAKNLARQLEVKIRFLDTDLMALPEFVANTRRRCYFCKRALFGELKKMAVEIESCRIAHGATVDDRDDFRPGHEAAREAGILAPLADAGLCKLEIRQLSKKMGLVTWNQAAASCLATRIPEGVPLDRTLLAAVEQAEAVLWAEGFRCFRVRHHGTVARIEVDPREISRLLDASLRKKIDTALQRIGFYYVALDLEGYTPGASVSRHKPKPG